MKLLVSDKKTEMGIGAALAIRASECWNGEVHQRTKVFADVIASFLRYRSAVEDTLGREEFALRLATSPSAAIAWADKTLAGEDEERDTRLNRLLDALLETPVVARAARYFAFALAAEARRHGVPETELSLDALWRW